MIRRLLLLVVALVAGWLWIRRSSKRAGRRPRGARESAAAGPMVRDRVCNTFLPKSRAIALREEDGVHYFCSAACRDKHLASAAVSSTP